MVAGSEEHTVNYDLVAHSYDARYQDQTGGNTLNALRASLTNVQAKHVLEVGCGTCYWLKGLRAHWQGAWVGLDKSMQMLTQVNNSVPLLLTQGLAENLPFKSEQFDVIYMVNVLHLINNPKKFILDAYRILRPKGVLILIGMDPHDSRNQWYIYDYFENTFSRDLKRYPPWFRVEKWLGKAGFIHTQLKDLEHIHDSKTSHNVLTDPFLQRYGCSQMALISDEDYQKGLTKIKSAIYSDKSKTLIFPNEIVISIQTAIKQ